MSLEWWTPVVEIAVPALTCGGTIVWHLATSKALAARCRADLEDLRAEVRKGAVAITEATAAVRDMTVRADERAKAKQELLEETRARGRHP